MAAALDPTGQVFAVATRNGKSTAAEIVSARTGRVVAKLDDPGIRSFAFSRDGQLLASGSRDRTARMWAARTGKLLHVLQHQGYVRDRAVLPERRVARDREPGRRGLPLGRRNRAARAPARRGERLGERSRLQPGRESDRDGFHRQHRADLLSSNGVLVAPLAGHTKAVKSVGFDPSGRTIVTGSDDGTARVWDALPAGTLSPVDIRTPPLPVQTLWSGNRMVTVAGREVRIFGISGRLISAIRRLRPSSRRQRRGTGRARGQAWRLGRRAWTWVCRHPRPSDHCARVRERRNPAARLGHGHRARPRHGPRGAGGRSRHRHVNRRRAHPRSRLPDGFASSQKRASR